MTREMGNDQSADTRDHAAIASCTAMTSNLITYPARVPIERRITMKQQPSQTEREDARQIATFTLNYGVGRWKVKR